MTTEPCAAAPDPTLATLAEVTGLDARRLHALVCRVHVPAGAPVLRTGTGRGTAGVLVAGEVARTRPDGSVQITGPGAVHVTTATDVGEDVVAHTDIVIDVVELDDVEAVLGEEHPRPTPARSAAGSRHLAISDGADRVTATVVAG